MTIGAHTGQGRGPEQPDVGIYMFESLVYDVELIYRICKPLSFKTFFPQNERCWHSF